MITNVEISFYNDGSKSENWTNECGKHHRDNSPAITHYHKNGMIKSFLYLVNGVIHRQDGPSSIVYDTNGEILHKMFNYNGKNFNSLEELQYYAKHQILL